MFGVIVLSLVTVGVLIYIWLTPTISPVFRLGTTQRLIHKVYMVSLSLSLSLSFSEVPLDAFFSSTAGVEHAFQTCSSSDKAEDKLGMSQIQSIFETTWT
jgi:hypothetical protein